MDSLRVVVVLLIIAVEDEVGDDDDDGVTMKDQIIRMLDCNEM